MEFTWNLTVCSLTSSREATPLLGRPSATSFRTSVSLAVNDAARLGADLGSGLANSGGTVGSVTTKPWLSAFNSAANASGQAFRLMNAFMPANLAEDVCSSVVAKTSTGGGFSGSSSRLSDADAVSQETSHTITSGSQTPRGRDESSSPAICLTTTSLAVGGVPPPNRHGTTGPEKQSKHGL